MESPVAVVVKTEPIEYPSPPESPEADCKPWSTERHNDTYLEKRICTSSEEPLDADVYLREYVKVEAIIDPKNIQKFVIPVDIPYTERRKKRSRRIPNAAEIKNSTSSNIGKIKMRKITELTAPKSLMITPASHRRSSIGSSVSSYQLPLGRVPHIPYHTHRDSHWARTIEPCPCPQCVAQFRSYSSSWVRPRPPPPAAPVSIRRHTEQETNFWRPFM